MKKVLTCLGLCALLVIVMPIVASGADPPTDADVMVKIVTPAVPTLEAPTSSTNEVAVSWADEGIVPTTLTRESFVPFYSHPAVIDTTDINEGLEVAIGAHTKPIDDRLDYYGREIETPRTWDVDLKRKLHFI